MQLGQPACWTPRRSVSIRTAPGKEKSGITRFARPYGHLFRFPLALRFADRGRAVWGLAEPTPESSGAGNTERRVKTNAPIKFREVPIIRGSTSTDSRRNFFALTTFGNAISISFVGRPPIDSGKAWPRRALTCFQFFVRRPVNLMLPIKIS